METAPGEKEEEGTAKPEDAPKTIGRSIYQRVQRLRARLLRPGAGRNPGDNPWAPAMERPAGPIEERRECRQVWLKPPGRMSGGRRCGERERL